MNFDINVLKSELYRYNLSQEIEELTKKLKLVCTLKTTKNILAKNNLKDLYKHVVKKDIINQHDASYDVLNLYEILKVLSSDGRYQIK